MKNILVAVLKTYKKFMSPVFVNFFGNGCKYQPTCSSYAIEAVEKFGVFRGVTLSIKRIASCHPFSKGGYNPVPDLN